MMSDQRSVLPDGLEKCGITRDGYEPLVRYRDWRVAVITYAERFCRKNLCRLERHTETDEVFVLMTGSGVLYIGREGTPVVMEPYAVYNVKRDVWHGISVSEDAKVLICENDDTGPENTEYRTWLPDRRER